MKRTITVFICILMLLTMFTVSVSAAENETVYLDDGSYIVISISGMDSRATNGKTGSKTYTYYDSDGTVLWKVVLSGTFTYTGSSSSCTAVDCSVSISDSAWYTISKSSGKSGNSATASVTMGEKLLGVTVKEVPVSLKLTCDANGNLS